MGSEFPSESDPGWALEQRRREANRPLEEAGEGESEGFELAEQQLIEHASHGDEHGTARILRDGRNDSDEDGEPDPDIYGEADGEPDDREDR